MSIVVKPGESVVIQGACDIQEWTPLGIATSTPLPAVCVTGAFRATQAVLFKSDGISGGYVGVLHLVPMEK
ncbi:MAG: hypothetical protein A2Z04_06770 [Chloroflexi bacterium RBG_16_57_9]|nr:MAG: hypothetical protein A2Z04_06770 [Chloroflexi bacterium RBG_16_57_9]